MEQAQRELQAGYDRLAAKYAAHFRDELERKPFDRKMLDWLIEKVAGAGPICDLGCGPGHVAAYLHRRGAEVCGLDLAPEMVTQARLLFPHLSFQTGDVLALADVPDGSWGGIAAFYSLIHVPRARLTDALRECRRALRPRGVILLTFHIGQEIRHVEELLGERVALDFHFFLPAEVKECLQRAGFALEEVITRDPYPEAEVQTQRAYIFARKP